MRVFFSHQSAIEFWRSEYSAHHVLSRARTQSLRWCVSGQQAVAPFEPWRFGIHANPIHVLVDEPRKRCSTNSVIGHSCQIELPTGSFCQLERDCFVASPELAFLHAAGWLNMNELIKLGYELCGDYALSTFDTRGFIKRPRVTTARQIQLFVKRANGVSGRKKAITAATYLLDGSASPMETALAMMLCLPGNLGGYGFSPPTLNCRVNLSDDAKAMAKRSFFVCDLLWPNQHVAVEYDSNQYHTEIERINADAIRRDVLQYQGITVITVTSRRIHSDELFSELVQLLAKQLNHRIRIRSKNWPVKHYSLRKCVLSNSD